MPSNNCKGVVHYLAGKYEGQIGHLYSPGGFRGPFPWLPYALDNGAFAGFDGEAFTRMCDKAHASQLTPKWVLVPDAVGDRDATAGAVGRLGAPGPPLRLAACLRGAGRDGVERRAHG